MNQQDATSAMSVGSFRPGGCENFGLMLAFAFEIYASRSVPLLPPSIFHTECFCGICLWIFSFPRCHYTEEKHKAGRRSGSWCVGQQGNCVSWDETDLINVITSVPKSFPIYLESLSLSRTHTHTHTVPSWLSSILLLSHLSLFPHAATKATFVPVPRRIL